MAIKEKLRDRQRNYTAVLLGTVVVFVFLFPQGLKDFEKFEGKISLLQKERGS